MRRAMKAVLFTLAGCAIAAAPARAEKPQSLDQAFLKQAPGILKKLEAGKYKNVGVLKFLVRQGDGPLSDNFGPINQRLADRLEVALLLALENDTPMRFAANATAAASARANHRTEAGRAEWFKIPAKKFKPAWGDSGEGVKPDIFLTGEARLAPDLKTIQVTVQAFGRDAPDKLLALGRFTALANTQTLTESGVTFLGSRGVAIPDEGEDSVPEKVAKGPDPVIPAKAESAPEEKDKERDKEIDKLLSDLPVSLEVLYDGKVQPVTGLTVPTPAKGSKVAFRLTNKGSVTCGVVLKVNGQSTIFQEEEPALQCYKWILLPGKSLVIDGYQKDDSTRQEFKVESPEKSKELEVFYGRNAGTISLVVFRAMSKGEEAVVRKEPERSDELKAVARGTMTTRGGTPMTLAALKMQLTDQSRADSQSRGSRGMIDKGAVGESKIEFNDSFVPFPRELGSITIRYYQASR